MASLCQPLPGESLSVRARRYAKDLEPFSVASAPIAEVRQALIAMADVLDRSFDDKQRTARLVVCGQCGHQVYRTGEGSGQ